MRPHSVRNQARLVERLLRRGAEHVLDALEVAAEQLQLRGRGDEVAERAEEGAGERAQRQHRAERHRAVEHLQRAEPQDHQRRARCAARR